MATEPEIDISEMQIETWRSQRAHTTIQAFAAARKAAGVTRIADLTGLDRLGIPVHAAYRPNAHSYAVQVGKGRTRDDSYASAMMEAIELFHAEQLEPKLIAATYEELFLRKVDGGDRVTSWRELKKTSESRFRPDLKIEWVSALDFASGEFVYVPYELVHARYAPPYDKGAGCFLRTTTGLASGNTMTEATIHGLAEVVERDAATLWLLSPKHARDKTQIDQRSIDSESIQSLIEGVQAAGLKLQLHDMTSDLKIAAVHAAIIDPTYGASHGGYAASGFGCHPHREVAVRRAITEAAQVRLVKIAGVRDELDVDHYTTDAVALSMNASATVQSHRHLRQFAELPSCRLRNLNGILSWMQKRLASYPIYTFDLTRPDLGVPVVRVIVPGLEDGMDIEDYCLGPRAIGRAIASMVEERA